LYHRLLPIIDEVLARRESGELGEWAEDQTVLVVRTDLQPRHFRRGCTEDCSGKKRRGPPVLKSVVA